MKIIKTEHSVKSERISIPIHLSRDLPPQHGALCLVEVSCVLQEQPLLQPTEASVSPLPSEKQSHSHFLAFYHAHNQQPNTEKQNLHTGLGCSASKNTTRNTRSTVTWSFCSSNCKRQGQFGFKKWKRHKRSRSIRNIYEQSLAAPELSRLDAHNLNADNSITVFPVKYDRKQTPAFQKTLEKILETWQLVPFLNIYVWSSLKILQYMTILHSCVVATQLP